jgi:hypothetical protein
MIAIKLFTLPLMVFMIGSTTFNKVVDDPSLISSPKVVSVNQEVTISIKDLKQSNCHTWTIINSPGYKVVSGGGEKDKTWTIKFTGKGTATIQCIADYCKYVNHGAPCGEHGCSGAKTIKTTINIQ